MYSFIQVNKIMKKILVFGLMLISVFSCDEIGKYVQFSVQTHSFFEIPAEIPAGQPVNLEPENLNLDLSIFKDFNTSPELVDKATIKNIKLNIVDPQNTVFNFLSDIEVYFETENLPKIRIAWLNDIQDNNVQTLDFEHLPDNLSEYIKDNQLKINVIIVTDEELVQPVQIEVAATFLIKAEIMEQGK